VPASVQIEPLRSAAELEELLPAIAAYQRFYEVEDVDEGRNRSFFARFLSPREDGAVLVAREDGEIRGYACLYWTFSSTRAVETVLMNDLFVFDAARDQGVGRALIEASAELARQRGAASLDWSTAPDNKRAQALYDSTGAARSEWIDYTLPT
jgi:GNAT superfamily N-acetyltransferase